MPSYSYKAFDSEGSVQSGFINAESERLARKEIKSLNLIPHKLKEIKSQTTKRYKIKNKDLVLATRQIGTLLEAAAQIDEALKMTAEQVKNKDLKNILFNLRDEIIQGKRLGNAMEAYPQVFDNTYVSLIKAGDTSGRLVEMFKSLSDYLEESLSINQKVRTALTYPFILFSFSIVVVISLLTFVMPQVVNQFVKSGVDLPLLTSILMNISSNMIYIIPSILLILAVSFFLL